MTTEEKTTKKIKFHETNIPDDIEGVRFQALSKQAKLNSIINVVISILAVIICLSVGYLVGSGKI